MPLLLHSLPHPHPILCFSPNHRPKPPKPQPSQPPPPLLLQFRTSHRQTLTYLKTLGLLPTTTSPPPPPETLHWILSTVEFLKSKGFSDCDVPRLSSRIPTIFSSSLDLAPVFSFLYNDLAASPEQARTLILRCPDILTSNPTHTLKPTLQYLSNLGIGNLNDPTNLNAHLLNTPLTKLVSKINFLVSWGIEREDAGRMCARCPAIFGYSVENNLRPKVEYLVYEMGRGVEEVREFPHYFAFSLERRIRPRHLCLKEKGVRIALRRMLFLSDEKFYAKWK